MNEAIDRVFLSERVPTHSYLGLKRFSKTVVPVFTRSVFPDYTPAQYQELCDQAVQVLAGFKPAKDILALDGDFVSMALCTWAITRDHDKFRIAKFDSKYGGYYLIPVG